MASDSNDQMDTTPIQQDDILEPSLSRRNTLLTQYYRVGIINTQNQISHFEVIDTSMDGNCLFRAVSQALFGHQDAHERIREEVVNYILEPANWPTFVNDIAAQSEDYERPDRRRREGDDAESEDDVLKRRYGTHMHRLGECGTFVEMIAASDLFQFNPVVLRMMDNQVYNILPMREPRRPVTFHFFFSGIGSDAGHFENLKPVSADPNTELVTFDIESGFYSLVTIDDHGVVIRRQPSAPPDQAGDGSQANRIRPRCGKIFKSRVTEKVKKCRKKK